MKCLSLFAALAFVAPIAFSQDASRGQKVFEECAACHLQQRGQPAIGPDLHGVLGEPAHVAADEETP